MYRGRASQFISPQEIDIAAAITYILQKVVAHMSLGQSYILRLLRKVENVLSEGSHAAEASRVGKIVQKLAQADDIHEALNVLHEVEGLDEFALKLMWLLDGIERGDVGLEDGVMDYQASVLGSLVTKGFEVDGGRNAKVATLLPNQIGNLYDSLHRFGRAIEELKRHSMGDGLFKEVDENRILGILNELASLGERAAEAGKSDVGQFVSACTRFTQYVLDNALFHDVRVVNVLDNANFTLQTVFETAGVEDNDSLQSTIQLLQQPQNVLD